MKVLSVISLSGLALLALTSCREAAQPVQIVSLHPATFERSDGRDCARMDSLHNHCATINFVWPEVDDGNAPLKTAVADWAEGFLVSLLAGAVYDSTSATLDAAASSFLAAHAQWSAEAPESPLGEWTANCADTVLLNDGKHLTLQLNAYVYVGGNHGSPVSCTATFDVAGGRQLTWDDLVTDQAALKTLAEKKFREVRADIFQASEDGQPGFDFDEIFPFALPQNYGLTEQGIYVHYDPYEVTPYAYGSTDFVLTFDELGVLRKGQ